MTDTDRAICRTQEKIYAYMCEKGYDMQVFSDAYLKSDFCKRAMDTIYSRFQLETPMECEDFYMPEIGDQLTKLPDDQMFDSDIARWIGYTYRQLYFESGISSAELADKIPFDVMCRYYPGMHTIDEDLAVETMLENLKRKQSEQY